MSDTCLLSAIDFADRTFPFSYGLLPDSLSASIAKVGLLQPPLLKAGENGYKIVCGRRRLEVLRNQVLRQGCGRTSGLEVCLASAKISAQELFRRALWDNLAIREFNPVEVADIYTAALSLFSRAEVEQEIMPALKLPLRSRFQQRCQALAGFSRELRDLVAAGIVDGETVDLLREWPEAAQTILLEILADFGLRRNKLREVVSRMDDLARRDRCSPLVFLQAVRKGVAAEGESGGVEGLRQYLKTLLYPHLSAAQLEFARRQAKFAWPAGLCLEPPPDFEGGRFRLSFTFTDAQEWARACDRLTATAREDIEELCRRG
ncbi:MAG: hypothetical protein JXR80_10525 [Deltaproteobacteria bacterium]|nr:hypothetical protein [Deltaproteobacteria bacterium]